MISDPSWGPLLGASTAALMGAGAASVVLSQKLQQRLLAKADGTLLADTLPFDHVDADGITLWSKNGLPTQILRLRGVLGEALTREQEQALYHQRHGWLQQLAERNVSLKVMTVRDEIPRALPATYENPQLQELHERWMASFRDSYVNSHALVFCPEPPALGWRRSQGAIPGLSTLRALKEAVELTVEGLQPLGPELLRHEEEVANPAGRSPLLSWWSPLLQGASYPVRPFHQHLSDRLVGASLCFDRARGLISWQQGETVRWEAIVSLNKWDATTSPALMADLTALPGRFVAVQHLRGMPKLKALMLLADQKKQSTLAWGATKNAEEFEAAIELIAGDETALYHYQCSFLVMAEKEEDVLALVSQVRHLFRQQGVTPLQETTALETAWRSFLPGYGGFLRPTTLLARNVASLLSFPQEAPGLERSDWGEGPLRLFKTAAGSSYALQLHHSEAKEALAIAWRLPRQALAKPRSFSTL